MKFKAFLTIRPLLLLVIAAGLLMPSCKNKTETSGLEAMFTSFGDEIGLRDNLTFTFNHDVLDNDSLVGQWHAGSYLKFEPDVPGRYQWIQGDQLVFSPAAGFEPATEYTISITDDLLKVQSKHKRLTGDTDFKVHTPYLSLMTGHAAWAKASTGETLARITTVLNFEVKGDVLSNHLAIRSGDSEVPFSILSEGKTATHTFKLDKDPDPESREKLKISLAKIDGLSKEQSTLTLFLEPRHELKITKAEAVAEGTAAMIRVYTSQEVAEDAVKDKLIMTPMIDHNITPAWYGFDITSDDIQVGGTYTIEITKGLEGELGGKLKNNFSQTVSFGEIEPDIAFDDSKAIYLGSRGNKNIPVTIVNVPKVKVSIYKVFENNLIHFLNRGKRWGSYWDYDEEYGYSGYYDYRYYEVSDVGQLVWEEDIATDGMDRAGLGRLLHLDFEDELKDRQGVYIVQVQDAEHYYISDSRIVSMSDLGLITKADKYDLYTFANSIKTANPIAGVEISIISSHNQVMATSKTAGDGIAKFSRDNFPEGFEPYMIVAEKEDDFNYMVLNNTRIATSRFDVGGKRTSGQTYDLFLYAERDIYRPGETIHMAGILRDLDWQVTGKMPLKVVLNDPNGSEFKTLRHQPDGQGMFSSDFDIPAAALTGSYVAEVYTGHSIYLGQKTFQVEEFMPDRIKVELTMDDDEYAPGDTMAATIAATNYFGPPAAGRNYEIDLSINQKTFVSDEHASFSFYLHNAQNLFNIFKEGKTGPDGKVTELFPVPDKVANYGMLSARAYATVFDETGRPVHQVEQADIRTQDQFIGIGPVDYWVGTSDPIAIPVIALDTEKKPVKCQAEVEVIQYQWHSVLRNSNGRYRYVSEREQITVRQEEITLNGSNTKYHFTPTTSGSYEVRISLPGANTYVQRSFYAYSWADSYDASFEVNREGNIDIEFDKDSYQPGEKAMAVLKLPFTGKLLITTERDAIKSYTYVDAKDRIYQYPVNIDDSNVPNTYITATLIKPHGESTLPLTVAHGFESFEVRPLKGKLDINIKAEKASRSRTKQRITLQAEPNSHLTVAVVDEGILALKNQQTADPYGHFYGKRALEVESHDLYPFLFPEVTATGGGADFASELAKRVNPLKNNRVKLVSFWSDVLTTDRSGKASFEVDIPQFSGSLRIMAVGSKNQKFGSSEAHITVADPIVLSSSIPRFLSMGDSWRMRVNVSNTTGKVVRGKLKVITNANLEASSETIELEIQPNSEASSTIEVSAADKMGVGQISTEFTALGETFLEETEITIRPSASLVKHFTSGMVKAGESIAVGSEQNFIPGSASGKLFISSSPLAQFAKDLDELAAYPFGCVEQTVSKAFPQIYFEELAASIASGTNTKADMNTVKRNVQAAIDKLKTMQLSNGALAYWPNGGYESWWGSAYAAHFLLETREKGYQVDSRMVDRLLDYLRDRLKQKETTVYYYNGTMQRKIISRETAYSLYVLALAGKPDVGTMKYYVTNKLDLSLDSRYILACSFIMMGDLDNARKIIPASIDGEKSVPTFGGSFNSYIRDLAISANALLEADPDHPQLPDMIRLLSTEMKHKKYLNTQEKAFGFLALGKYARLNPIGKATASVKKDGEEIASFKGEDLWVSGDELSGSVSLDVAGEGYLYYTLQNEGLPADGKVLEADNHLKVRRTFYTPDQKVITSNRFNQNDLIVVRITLKTLTGKYMENVAVTDILPAGLEIENARITEMPDLDWVNANANYDHKDIRDDRISFFLTARGDEQTFYYLARAVTPGTYQIGPVSADAMYNGEFHSYHGSGKVIVEE